ncbi:hypothetical protein I4544_21125 [Klebsiella michiganensis]|uniref:hypothetical protein n=1 Tax=Klebsiella michiganensis TaxID=1134687 RepID=UPI0018C4B37B|nr:hypothetical protein [Klebsiella michiganensis]MBG2588727.1 hypothetical protein [Klebsiella michiganensis]
MISRYKWLLINTEYHLDDIVEILHNHKFNNHKYKGYIVNNIDNESLNATFIERVIQSEKINRPDGTEDDIKIERYIYTLFKIKSFANGKYLMRVENPPRALNEFFSFWKSIFNKNFFIEPVKIDVMEAINSIKHSFFRNVRIRKVKTSGIAINITTFANIEVISSSNALEVFLDEFGRKKFKFEYAKISAIFDGASCSLEIKTTGIISDNEGAIDFLQEKLMENNDL